VAFIGNFEESVVQKCLSTINLNSGVVRVMVAKVRSVILGVCVAATLVHTAVPPFLLIWRMDNLEAKLQASRMLLKQIVEKGTARSFSVQMVQLSRS
jgi:hypothetical protein